MLRGMEDAAAPEPRAMRSRRVPRCDGCGLAGALCFCATLRPLANRTRVVVVVHRNEVRKSTNTGGLAVRLLERAELRVRGDHLAPPPEVSAETREARRLVLFPAPGARVITASDLDPARPLVLVVPDGSWSQARKIARRDPLTEGAETVTLPPGPASRYGLRRSPRPGGLCTLEAIARALGVLEGGEIEPELLAVLDVFVARHRAIGRRGPLS